MKSLLYISVFAVISLLSLSSCQSSNPFGVKPYKVSEAGLSWYQIEDLEKMSNIQDKKVLVDVYTDWCGWCKKLDKGTFTDPEVVKYLNENFVMVKFNAEQLDPITFKGETYEAVQMGRKKTNKLAVKFLNGRLGYPNLVYLQGSSLEKIKADAGYKTPEQLMAVLQSIVTNPA